MLIVGIRLLHGEDTNTPDWSLPYYPGPIKREDENNSKQETEVSALFSTEENTGFF